MYSYIQNYINLIAKDHCKSICSHILQHCLKTLKCPKNLLNLGKNQKTNITSSVYIQQQQKNQWTEQKIFVKRLLRNTSWENKAYN